MLPPLIKKSSTYPLLVKRKVEEKIRYLLRKFPHTEWSGVLFTRYTGSFEDGTLEIYCEDLFPMDLGNATYTTFYMNEDVTAYIADNIELFDCDCQLIHSHHSMSSSFSSIDLSTLQDEGNDRNCFVSLIVNHEGTYSAAITRKVTRKTKITKEDLGSSYEFFGEGTVCSDSVTTPSVENIEDTVIEYFMLDVRRETVDNPLEFLDRRFDEIQQQKKAADRNESPVKYLTPMDSNPEDNSYIIQKPAALQQSFDFPKEHEVEESDSVVWSPDAAIIHHMVCQMVTCAFIINSDIDLKKWIEKNMMDRYESIFKADDDKFEDWGNFIVDFQISHYDYTSSDIPEEIVGDYDLLYSRVASAMYEDLDDYPSNEYIEEYKNILTHYIYE